MESFSRQGPSPFRGDCVTQDTDIIFPGGSRLKVYGGSPYNSFRLRFSNNHNEGWWVQLETLEFLIAELLYIRKDMQRLKEGIVVDVEVGRVPEFGDDEVSRLIDVGANPEDNMEEEEEDETF